MARLIQTSSFLLILVLLCSVQANGQNNTITVYELKGRDSIKIEMLSYDASNRLTMQKQFLFEPRRSIYQNDYSYNNKSQISHLEQKLTYLDSPKFYIERHYDYVYVKDARDNFKVAVTFTNNYNSDTISSIRDLDEIAKNGDYLAMFQYTIASIKSNFSTMHQLVLDSIGQPIKAISLFSPTVEQHGCIASYSPQLVTHFQFNKDGLLTRFENTTGGSSTLLKEIYYNNGKPEYYTIAIPGKPIGKYIFIFETKK